VEAERLRRIGIALDQRRRETVDRRRVRTRAKHWLTRRIERDRVGCEVDVERVVLLEDDDEMLDRRARRRSAGSRGGARTGHQEGDGEDDEQAARETRARTG